MLQNQTFYNSLLQCMNQNRDSSVLFKFAVSMQYAAKSDLYQILELLHITHDMRTQVKLLSILAVYMISNGIHSDIIIKFNPLYDKICMILTRGLPQKTNVTLNFLTALLYTDNEQESTQRKTLVVYAQNMIRASGCLTAMSNLFTSCMLHQDTWRALCRCLAETCCGLEVNQNYCSHLIPLCVRRCQQGSEHVFQLLQNLLCNNEHNVRLFYESGGNCVFTREYLKYDQCLQLLNTIASETKFKINLLEDTNILHNLLDLKQIHGHSSHVGQWVTIIFYSMRLNSQEFTKEIRKKDKHLHNLKNVSILQSLKSDDIDTSELFQKVLKEVLNFEPRKNVKTYRTSKIYKPNVRNDLIKNNFKEKPHDIKQRNTNHSILLNLDNVPQQSDNLSFSFLLRKNSDKPSTNISYVDDANFSYTKTIVQQINLSLHESHKNMSYYFDNTITNDRKGEKESILLDFRPTIVSTPKNIFKTKFNTSSISHISQRPPINKHKNRRFKRSNDERKAKTELNKLEKSHRLRTIGARLFDVINESCTTIINSVKNVFKAKKIEENVTKETGNIKESHCSNSFMNYMRKRDALLNEQNSNWNSYRDDFRNECNTCNTCNDTLSLKRKFANDVFLKETVKKLKLGINLYGCDFKKISKTLWPHENYMTPSVLYNLYRKLIAK